jgi:hypothetical protein
LAGYSLVPTCWSIDVYTHELLVLLQKNSLNKLRERPATELIN